MTEVFVVSFIVGLISSCFGFVLGRLWQLGGKRKEKKGYITTIIRYPNHLELREKKLQGLETENQEDGNFIHG